MALPSSEYVGFLFAKKDAFKGLFTTILAGDALIAASNNASSIEHGASIFCIS